MSFLCLAYLSRAAALELVFADAALVGDELGAGAATTGWGASRTGSLTDGFEGVVSGGGGNTGRKCLLRARSLLVEESRLDDVSDCESGALFDAKFSSMSQ